MEDEPITYQKLMADPYTITRALGIADAVSHTFINHQNCMIAKIENDITYAICLELKSLKTAGVQKYISIATSLSKSVLITAIVAYGFSAPARTYLSSIGVRPILFDVLFPSLPHQSKIGRYAKLNHNVEMETLYIRVPKKGYPELGFAGPLTADSIYKLIQAKVDGIKSDENPIGTMAFNVLYRAFKDMLALINDDKNITKDRWNKIMNENAVYDFLEQNGEELEKVTEDVV